MNNKLNSLFLLFLLILGCKKKDNVQEAVQINLFQPADHQTYNLGDTVFVNAEVKSEIELHGYELKIVSNTDDSVLFITEEHQHQKQYEIDKYWVNHSAQTTAATLILKMEISHEGDSKTETRTIQLNH